MSFLLPSRRLAFGAGLIFLALIPLAELAAAKPQVDWDQKISLKLRDADLVQVLSSFATIGGGDVVADPGVDGKVSVDLEEVSWSDALDRLCRLNSLACYWQPGAPPILRVGSPDVGFTGLAESIDLELRGADLAIVLGAMKNIADQELEIEEGIEGSVSFELHAVPWPVALEHICLVGGCEVLWSATPVRVVGAPEKRIDEETIEVSTRTDAAVERLARSAALGPMAPLEVEVYGDLPAYVDEPIDGGPWASSLDALCRRLECTWELIYGEPSKLRLRARDPRTDQAFAVPEGEVQAEDLARRLADAAGASLEVHALVDLGRPVKPAPVDPTWNAVADLLCGRSRCTWRLGEDTLELVPVSRSVAPRPERRASPVELGVHVRSERRQGGSTAIQASATRTRFTWAEPVTRLAVDGSRWLHLAWIPFDEQVVLPLLADCANGEVEVLEPVALPLEENARRRSGPVSVELTPPVLPAPPGAPRAPRAPKPPSPPEPAQVPSPDSPPSPPEPPSAGAPPAPERPAAAPRPPKAPSPTSPQTGSPQTTSSQPPAPPAPKAAPPSPPPAPSAVPRAPKPAPAPPAPPSPPAPPADCLEAGTVIVRLDEVGGPASRTELQLGRGVGDYLLITPPTGGARPAAAVVRLGQERGAPQIALVRPVSGTVADLETTRLGGEPLRTELEHDGRRFRLEVSAGSR